MKKVKIFLIIFAFLILLGGVFQVKALSVSQNITVTVGPGMTGSLTPSSTSCLIPQGQNSCNVNFSWSVTNPISNTAITKPVNVTVATGHSGNNVPFSVKYDSETFYLYNNAQLLDQETVFSSCEEGTFWNGSFCASSVIGYPVYPVCSGPSVLYTSYPTYINTGIYLYYDQNLSYPYNQSLVGDENGNVYYMDGNRVGLHTGNTC